MKNKNKVYWVWLSLICGPSSRKAVRILRRFGDAVSVFKADASELLSSGALSEKEHVYRNILAHDTAEAEDIVSWCSENGVDVITPEDDDYPSNLYSLRDAPLALYCVGRLPDFDKVCSVAVVGSRRMSEYGRANSFRFGYGLAKGGAVVVSGLALGVDGMSMASAAAAGGICVGVLGSGIDTVYPKEHAALYKAVVKNGAIVTEYPPGSRPSRGAFPQRNRIISGLSQGTLVVEASADSGSLITARHAIYQGKDLFAVPGAVGSPLSEGTNALIKECAFAVTDPADILERYEYVYPHSIDVSSMKKSLAPVDIASSAERTLIKYGVTTEDDRHNVYSVRPAPFSLEGSPVVRTGKNEAGDPDPFLPEYDGGKRPDVLSASSKKAKKKEKGFDKAPSEPKRVDFELLNENDKKVYNAMIPDTPMIPEELIADGITIADVMASLTMLEISGAVEAGAGGYFMRCGSDDITLSDEE